MLASEEVRNANIIFGPTCLWDSGDTNIMIKRQYTKNYERKMSYNNAEYSTYVGTYFTAHDIKVPFFIPEFLAEK